MSAPRYILDTGPLVAYVNSRDQHHAWACGVLDAIGEPPLIPEVVLAEACWILRTSKDAVRGILGLPENGLVKIIPVFGPNQREIGDWMSKYWPRMDVADACVLAVAHKNPKAKIITTDIRDFTLYRLNDQPLSLIIPSP
jgi:predicted nucleic acid-binding protein